jgi:hypothetical protein
LKRQIEGDGMRTNCNNCGAPLVDGKCKYCGTTWFTPGFQLGGGFITWASIEFGREMTDITTWADSEKKHLPGREYSKVELTIEGLSGEEIGRLYESMTTAMAR